MLKQRKISVLKHDPLWAVRFKKAAAELEKVLGDNAVTIEHIGSTSVVGLAAKPIIDILVEVKDLVLLDEQQSAIEALGYVARGENTIVGRRYFQKGGVQRTHHIHAFQTGNPHLTEHRAFRDYLFEHPRIADEYAQVKIRAVDACQNDIERYMQLKNDFIIHHMALALIWYANLRSE